jgi:hypothetical protein
MRRRLAWRGGYLWRIVRICRRGGCGCGAAFDPYAGTAQPWWQQQQQAPQQGAQFSQPPPPVQAKQWWQGLPAAKSQTGQSADQSGQPAKQPSLYDMMLNLGRMTPADYNKVIKGGGAPSGSYGARGRPCEPAGRIGADRGNSRGRAASAAGGACSA